MRLNYLALCLSVVVLVMSGCLGGGGEPKPDTPFKTYLGTYVISFNLTSEYDYNLGVPNHFHESKGSSYFPDYKMYTRIIEDKTNSMYHFDVSVIEYSLPQAQTMEALNDELSTAKEYTAMWTTYDSDHEFQHTYRVKDFGYIEAVCWLDEKNMLRIYADGWDIRHDGENFNITNILKSLRTRKYQM